MNGEARASRRLAELRERGAPERPVACIVGDGSIMYSPQALWTAARYNLNVLTQTAVPILLQARGTGLSSTFGGESTAYRSRRGLERTLFRITVILIIFFVAISLYGARQATTG